MLVLLFLAKVLDRTLCTTKTIFVQRNRGLLTGTALGISDLIYLTIIKNVVVDDSLLPILVVALGGAVGCWLAVKLGNHFSKDQLYINVLLSDNKEAVKAFAEYLRNNGITCIANDCYTKDLNGKTLSLTAYAETKAQSSIISAYTKANPNVFKRVVKK